MTIWPLLGNNIHALTQNCHFGKWEQYWAGDRESQVPTSVQLEDMRCTRSTCAFEEHRHSSIVKPSPARSAKQTQNMKRGNSGKDFLRTILQLNIHPQPFEASSKLTLITNAKNQNWNWPKKASNRGIAPTEHIPLSAHGGGQALSPTMFECASGIPTGKKHCEHAGQCKKRADQKVGLCLHASARYAIGVTGHSQEFLGWSLLKHKFPCYITNKILPHWRCWDVSVKVASFSWGANTCLKRKAFNFENIFLT